ncbi:MAG: hypothetical protein K6E63_02895 [Lachnospiraceae bacterium]|nr:hypothetical protein [Lachnospiraceae bacterium]
MIPGMLSCFKWLIACLILAMTARTYLRFLTLKFPDGGFVLSLGMSIAAVFMTVWLLCTVFKVSFDTPLCIAAVLIWLLPIFIINIRRGSFDKKRFKEGSVERRRFIIGFAVFALLFFAAVWVKGFKPGIDHQTEQYMDYGFMMAMYRQKCMPFEDIWFAGKSVNYYYLGQAVAVFMCFLARITPSYGYNLMLCMIFAFLTLGVFSLTSAFLSSFGSVKRTHCMAGGTAAAIMCSMGGNGHWIIYGIIKQIKEKILYGEAVTRYWFPSSTLFIGSEADAIDKGKHEFPSYTLVLGDLHAHVVNMLFVIPLLMIVFDYALKDKEKDKYSDILCPHIFITAMLLGLFRGVNYWDFPIYFVVAGAVILFSDIIKYKASAGTFAAVALKGLIVYAAGLLLILPFKKTYIVPTTGIHLCDRHSPADKLIIIWFVHVIMAISLLAFITLSIKKEEKGKTQLLTAAGVTMCGLGLLILPEIIYVKDIYGDDFQRYNTMFKLTFQGFILLSIAGGICIGIFLGRKYLKAAAWIYCAAALMLSTYMGWAVKEWFGNVVEASNRQGIDAAEVTWSDPSYDDVRDAIKILNSDNNDHLHIIEEAGDSYSPCNRLSVFAGAATTAGWYVHEWVWRNDPDIVRERHGEVKLFYECGDESICREIIDRYGIDYIYVGPKTTEKYVVDYDGFMDLGEIVWENSDQSHMLIRISDS